MQLDQLFEFVYILIDKKKVTAKEMSERFGVSGRTIYRWVEALSISGIPVYSLKGRGGGIAISEGFCMDNTVLSEEERMAVVSSLKAFNSLSGSSQREFISKNKSISKEKTAGSRAADKLSGLVPSDTDWLEVDFAPWSPEGSEVRNLFGLLRDSILKKIVVSFDYFTSDGRNEKVQVEPWKLVFRGQAWYLYGYNNLKNGERFYKLSRMQKVLQTGRAVTKQKPNLENTAYIPETKPDIVQLQALVNKNKISFLMDAYVCSKISLLDDGSFMVNFFAPDQPWLCEFLLGFGPDLTILYPEKIKAKVCELAGKVCELYKKD